MIENDILFWARYNILKEEKKHEFLDEFYNPSDVSILESVNYTRHFLGKAIPKMKRALGRDKFIERANNAFNSIKTKVPKDFKRKITLLNDSENPCRNREETKQKINS